MEYTYKQAVALREQLETLSASLPDEQAAAIPSMARPWAPEGSYTAETADKPADRVERLGYLYKCLQNHDALGDPNRAPEVYHAGWLRIPSPAETGERNRPIIWGWGMSLTTGLYYLDEDILYYCYNGTGNVGMQYALKDLVAHVRPAD